MKKWVKKGFKGNPPPLSIIVWEIEGWNVCVRHIRDKWYDMKMFWPGRKLKKANYWLSYNPHLKMWGRRHDTGILATELPEIYKEIAFRCDAEYGGRLRRAGPLGIDERHPDDPLRQNIDAPSAPPPSNGHKADLEELLA